MDKQQLGSSFRDPSGFVFSKDEMIYRQINPPYIPTFDRFVSSGLYQALVAKEFLVSHEEVERTQDHIILKPQQLPLITYPYEWSFSQLQAAAILTLHIQLQALNKGMTLKDGTAYNVQFIGSHPLFIDTLSFEPYQEGRPWKAYGQFCRHFLAPLLLAKHVDIRCLHLLQHHLDGIPLDLASHMLPWKSHWSMFIKLHIHLHARYLAQHNFNATAKRRTATLSLQRLQAMLQSLLDHIQKLDYTQQTEWGDYYAATKNYSPEGLDQKRKVVRTFLEAILPKGVWDIGGNDGTFSRLAKDLCPYVISTDIDLQAVDQNFRQGIKNKERNVWPLFFDVINPTPDKGMLQDQQSLEQRIKSLDITCLLALALIHHLAITHNYPFSFLATFFSRLAPYLIIEFVQPSDSWAKELLERKDDAQELFDHYNQKDFEQAFGEYYSIERKERLEGTERVLYLMKRKT